MRRLNHWVSVWLSICEDKRRDNGLRVPVNCPKQWVVDCKETAKAIVYLGRYLLPQGVDWQKITLKESTIGDVLAQALLDGDTSGLEFDNHHRFLLVQSYADFYTSNVEKYGELLPLVMSSGNRPIDIHCAGGAGRTGFTVALIQLVLGVTEVYVMDDYLLTNEVIASDLQEAVEYFLETIRTNTGQEPTEEDGENLTNFVTMHSEYLQAALDRVAEEYGSFDNFIRNGIGITDEQRNAFRAALLY